MLLFILRLLQRRRDSLQASRSPRKLPCPDNCGVSINWHVDSDYKSGWAARITLFNWEEEAFANWFSAVQMKNLAYPGFEKAYSFNATKPPGKNSKTIFMQGLPGLNCLVGETNGTHPDRDPNIPGKQQTVISFTKRRNPGIDILRGDGFPAKVFFNGKECAIPNHFPKRNGSRSKGISGFTFAIVLMAVLNSVLSNLKMIL